MLARVGSPGEHCGHRGFAVGRMRGPMGPFGTIPGEGVVQDGLFSPPGGPGTLPAQAGHYWVGSLLVTFLIEIELINIYLLMLIFNHFSFD